MAKFALTVAPENDLTADAQDVVTIPSAVTNLRVGTIWRILRGGNGMDLSLSAFAFRAGQEVAREEDFVFFGQPDGVNDAVKLYPDLLFVPATGYDETIDIDFGILPDDVERIVFTATIEGPKELPQMHVGNISYIDLSITAGRNVVTVKTSNYAERGDGKTAIVLGEMRKVGSAWQFVFKSEPVEGGLSGLCAMFGIETN